jgi:hypothetical protein
VWPIPGDRWDPNRIGRAVLVIFAALLVIVVLLLIFNVFGGSPTPAARHRKGAGAAAGTARSEAVSPDGITIPADIAQRSLPDAEQALIKLGLLPHTVPATDTAGAPGTIVGVSPSPGVTAAPGSVVTLQVIPGPGHGKDHGHKEPPGHAKKHKEGD